MSSLNTKRYDAGKILFGIPRFLSSCFLTLYLYLLQKGHVDFFTVFPSYLFPDISFPSVRIVWRIHADPVE